ncbi:MAG TPA: hypothetical protein VFG06_11430, partial [Thermodesulfovibrionales bacterium]|nr:hypothetical protein [Thermodesulfovibrionales bacterium]
GGERVNAGKEKSHNEKSCCKKEDRKKEEVNFPLHTRTQFFGLGKIFSSLFFMVFSSCGL